MKLVLSFLLFHPFFVSALQGGMAGNERGATEEHKSYKKEDNQLGEGTEKLALEHTGFGMFSEFA